MPAQSPTLSPTLSAMVAGLRGSSSGMPASTLPTRSAPTSAPLVKMPPPSSGEDRDQRGAEAERDQRVNRLAIRGRVAERAGQNAEIASDAEKREPGDQQPGHRARAEGDVETAGEGFRRRLRSADIGAHRDVHADEAGGAGGVAPIANPIATVHESRSPSAMNTTTPTPAMVMYWRRR